MQRYFAYGSNLSTQQMRKRCPSARVLSRCTLAGWRLDFAQPHDDWNGGVASIVRAPDGVVHGVIYEISDADLGALDQHEPVEDGSYRRTTARVRTATGESLECWVYVGEVLPGAPFAPSVRYIQTLLAGAREHHLPADYIAEIERQFPAWDA